MKIRNISNAFLRIECGQHVLLCDMWLTKGIFDGNWFPFPPVLEAAASLDGATHCLISHIHQDHFDLAKIAFLNRNIKILIPDLFPNDIMVGILTRLGFKSVIKLPLSTPTTVEADLVVEALPPMNDFGQETQDMEQDEDNISAYSIDSAFIINTPDGKLCLLSDDSPYSLKHLGSSLERIKNCDLLAIPYNGYAGDYPVCYTNLKPAEITRIADEQSFKRAQLQMPNIKTIAPKNLLLYSSEFAVAGPNALNFAKLLPAIWTDKQASAQWYQNQLAIPSHGLYETDFMEIKSSTVAVVKDPAQPSNINLEAYAESLYSPIPQTRHLFRRVTDWKELDQKIDQAAQHMFEKMVKRNLKTDWLLIFELLDDSSRRIILDLHNLIRHDEEPANRRKLICRLESNYFAALLDFHTHWDDAQISYNLKWYREPNEMDHRVHQAICFFHRPIKDTRKPLFH